RPSLSCLRPSPAPRGLPSFPTRRSSDLYAHPVQLRRRSSPSPVGGIPLVLEHRNPVSHHRPLHTEHLLMPETVAGLIRNAEIIGEAGTTDERHLIVNEEELAVLAVQIGPPAPEAERVVETQLDPALVQALAVLLTQVPAARPIEQTAYPHAPGRRCGEDREDPVEALPRLHQIEFDIDGLLRLLHGLDQLRKETVAIHHEFEAVVFPPG